MVKREGRNWRMVATEQRIRRAVRVSMSSAAQLTKTPMKTRFSPVTGTPSFSRSLAILRERGDPMWLAGGVNGKAGEVLEAVKAVVQIRHFFLFFFSKSPYQWKSSHEVSQHVTKQFG
ncbi:hypothetical protein LINPERPRIM_LOCUS37519 [Linum perenne]